jgi:hypothetical protein
MNPASMARAMSEQAPLDWPAQMPRIEVDQEASSLTYSIDDKELPSDTQWLIAMRSQIARGLESTANPSGAPLPIRFKAKVHGTSENVAFTRCLLGIGWFYWGCPGHEVQASATITLDIGGKLFHGAGQAKSETHLIWYNSSEITDSQIAAYMAILEATRTALRSSPHAALMTDLERQLAHMLLSTPSRRRAP